MAASDHPRDDPAAASSATRKTSVFAQPGAWLALTITGLALAGIGVFIDAWRHDHGADPAGLISWSSPGMLIALGGLTLAGLASVSALAIMLYHDADTPESVARRTAVIVVASIALAGGGIAGVTYAATSDLMLGHVGHTPSTPLAGAPPRITPTPTAGAVPGIDERVRLTGTLTIDGRPLDTAALGVYVIRDGLITSCQADIPAVTAGRYEIPVMSGNEAHGCGGPGAQILLWIASGGRYVYTRETLPWPSGTTADWNATFASAVPDGAVVPHTAFKGHVVRPDATRLRGGTLVEAFVGETRCGVAAVRRDEEAWFTLLVAGPTVPGCDREGRITFRVNGAGVGETARNTLGDDAAGLTIELTSD